MRKFAPLIAVSVTAVTSFLLGAWVGAAPAQASAEPPRMSVLWATPVALPPAVPGELKRIEAYSSERDCIIAKAALEGLSRQWRAAELTGLCLRAGAQP